MGTYYHPPGPYVGRGFQPYDGRKGVNPAILNNPPAPPGYVPTNDALWYAAMWPAYQPPPTQPWFGYDLNPFFLNNPIGVGGGWNMRDPIYQAVIIPTAWIPIPPQPQRLLPNPVLLNRVDNPPPYSIVQLATQYVLAWQVTWTAPALEPVPSGRTIAPPSNKFKHSWHVGPKGIETQISTPSEVDSDPPDT